MLAPLLIALLAICSFGPGFFIARRFRLTPGEALCTSIGLSITLLYLAATAIYLSQLDWRLSWAITGLCAVVSAGCWRDLAEFARRPQIRRQLFAFAAIFSLGLVLLGLIQHYSGAGWANDWLEHFQRANFFLKRQPHETKFLGNYLLPARPPLLNLLAAFFMAQTAARYEYFQVICLFFSTLVLFPCVLIAGVMVRYGSRKVWPIAAMLTASPVFVQNATYTWTKLPSAFFVMLAVALYVRGWRRQSPARMILASAAMTAGMLVHYSAGPFAVFLAGHYLYVWVHRRRPAREAIGAVVVAIVLFATWAGWSLAIYGARASVASNTAVTGAETLSFGANIAKVARNIASSLVPVPIWVFTPPAGVEFDQPNPYGLARDYYFAICQSNLPLSLGPLGWLVILALLLRFRRTTARPLVLFWGGFIVSTAIIGTAVHGTFDPYGVAHVCLQPLTLIGLAFLAASFGMLTPWMRAALLGSIVTNVVLGVLLQMRMEMLLMKTLVIRNSEIVPLASGLLNAQAVCNSAARFQNALSFVGDHFRSAGVLLFGVILIGYGILVFYLAASVARMRRGAASSDRVHPAVIGCLAAYLIGASICLTDRLAGYRTVDIPDHPQLPSYQEYLSIMTSRAQAVSDAPESAEAAYSLAEACYQFGQADHAWTNARNALLLDPYHKKAHYLLGLLARSGFGGAERALGLMLYERRQFTTVQHELTYAAAILEAGFPRRCRAVLMDAVRRFPESDQARNLLESLPER